MSPTELNPTVNERVSMLAKAKVQGLTVGMVSLSVVIAILALVMSWSAVKASMQANAIAETWQSKYSETERECRLAQMEIDDFRIVMIKSGLDIEHIGEKP